MADVTTTVHVRVTTFDPAQRTFVPVPGARVLVEDSGWLWDPNLSTGNDTTDASGVVAIALTYDGDDATKLNPLFTVTVPQASRAVPASSPADRQVTLPDEWETQHAETHTARDLLTHTDPANAFEIVVGLPAQICIAYSDFDTSGVRNPLALPARTARVYLADYDTFLFIDFLNPDDTLTGFGFDPVTNHTVPAGDHDDYPYFDTWPTAPSALAADPGPEPRAWLDPPGMGVGMLGGGSFTTTGPLAVDGHGFVFMVDGAVVRRFYPDGTLAETIAMPGGGVPTAPAGLAIDQYRTLFVADAANHRILIFQLARFEGQAGIYIHAGSFGSAGNADGQFALPTGLAVIPNRVVDAAELLAVVDSGNQRVQLFTITLTPGPLAPGTPPLANRVLMFYTVALAFLTKFGSGGTGAGQFQLAVGIAADRQGRLFVCDSTQHRVSRWSPNGAATAWTHDVDWEHAGGGAGAGDGEFNTPLAVAVDSTRNTLYVADSQNARVQRLDADSGAHQVDWTAADIAGLAALAPTGVAIDARGEVYVGDPTAKRVVRGTPYAPDGSLRAAGEAPRLVGTPWTPATEPDRMQQPGYVAYGPNRTLWVADTQNDRVLVYTLAELAAPAAPEVLTPGLSHPTGIAVHTDGTSWVVDSGNSRVLPLDAAHAAGTAIGSAGAGANQFNDPRGIALVARETVLRVVGDAGAGGGGGPVIAPGTPLLFVADRGNNRVQVLQGDGTFLSAITTDGTTALSAPEDVTVSAGGQVFIADTGNARIVRLALRADGTTTFQKAFPVPLRAPGVAAGAPCGVSMDPGGSLLVTDRAQGLVLRLSVDGDVQAYWDLHALLRLRRTTTTGVADFFYEPELAQMLLLSFPARAVLDEAGVMAIADSGQDRVRLLRAFNDIRVTLFDLGESQPDISVRAVMQREYPELGLKLNVGDVSIFDDSQEFSTEPIDDFAGERFETTQVIGPAHGSNAAVNVMRVVRTAQSWYGALTHADDADHRWATAANARTLNVDLISGEGSYQFLDVNLGVDDAHGRGSDAWDDSTIAHEFSHWVFYKAVEPYPPFSIAGLIQLASSHGHQTFRTPNVAMSEGWAEYAEMSWGGEYGAIDRVRGYSMTPSSEALTTIRPYANQAWRFLPGGSAVAPATTPTFDQPEQALPAEGYFANALYQVHRALVDPGVLFADSPAYWHRFNVHVTDAASTRYSSTIWRALRSFPADPPMSDIDQGSLVYLRTLLTLARTEQPALAQTVRSILELNNLLMPRISITEGTSTTDPGTALSDNVHVTPGGTRELIIRVTDATGASVGGYNLRLTVGDTARYALVGGPPPIRHGRRRAAGAPPSTTELYRATNVSGIVRVTFTAPALPPGTTSLNDTLRVEYQPDFDSDDTFSPPEAGDDLETTLRRLYLYELRGASKSWAGSGNNLGAIVSRSITFGVSA